MAKGNILQVQGPGRLPPGTGAPPLVVIVEDEATCVPVPEGCRGPPVSGTCCFPSPCVAPPVSAAVLNEASEGGLPPPSSCRTPSAKRCSASRRTRWRRSSTVSPASWLWLGGRFMVSLITSADQGLIGDCCLDIAPAVTTARPGSSPPCSCPRPGRRACSG